MYDVPPPLPEKPVRFMDQFRAFIRSKHMSYRTEKTYCQWVVEFIRFHGRRHPKELKPIDIDNFLSYLAVKRNVAVNTQKTALNALVFLYQKFLVIEVGELAFKPSSRERRLPTVFSHREAIAVIDQLSGVYKILVSLMYGSGLRVMEAVRLRVQDIDLENGCIIVREAKGNYWRRTLLPSSLVEVLKNQLKYVQAIHNSDLADGYGAVYLPFALARKYPRAEKEFGWQYLFPAKHLSIDPRSEVKRRHYIGEQSV